MSFQSIAGQALAKRMLQNGIRMNRISHAYIFHGPSGAGRLQTAVALAKTIFCVESGDDACGNCLECRKVDHGNHVGLHMIEPDGSTIKIEQIRQLQKQFGFRTAASVAKIYIMKQADRMTIQAANSLLKFLEEPGLGIIAILLTENGHALLPTIRSRAQWIPFMPMPPRQIAAQLTAEGIPANLAAPASHMAAGLDAARELAVQTWFADLRNIVLQLAEESFTRFGAALLTVQLKVVKSGLVSHLDSLFELFVLWFKEMIHIQCDRKDHLVFTDHSAQTTRHAFAHPLDFWVDCLDRAVQLKKRLRSNVNPQLLLEQLIIGLQR